MTSTPLAQPWKAWYCPERVEDISTHYIVPVMAAGNRAPVSQDRREMDLSKKKPFVKYERHGIVRETQKK